MGRLREYDKKRQEGTASEKTTSRLRAYDQYRNATSLSERYSEYLKKYNDFYEQNKNRYTADQSAYQSDYGNWFDTVDTVTSELNSEAAELRRLFSEYKDAFDGQTMNDILATLGGTTRGSLAAYNQAKEYSDYWSQWSGEEEYNKWYDNTTYGSKYDGKTYADIQKALETAEGREKDWLTSNADSYMNSLDAQAEIDEINKQLDDIYYKDMAISYGYQSDGTTLDDLRAQREELQARKSTLEGIRDTAKRSEQIERYDQYKDDKMFSAKAGRGGSFTNPTIGELNEYQVLLEREATGDPERYKELVENPVEVKNKVHFYLDNPGMKGYTVANPAAAYEYENILHDGLANNWDELTEEEIQMYDYLLYMDGETGSQLADQYLEDIQVVLDKRATDTMNANIQKAIEEGGFWTNVAMSVASVPANIIGGITSFLDNTSHQLKGESINPYSPAQSFRIFATTVRGEVGAEIADTATWELFGQNVMENVYNAVMSSADSVVGGKVMGKYFTLAMGSGAAASQAAELYERGASNSQIFWGGLAAGVAEAVFEKVSLDNLLKEKNPANLRQFALEVLKQAGIEGSEEVATEIANLISDGIIMGSNSDLSNLIKKYENGYYDENGIYHESLSHEEAVKKAMTDKVSEVVWSGISGMISGGVSSFGVTGMQTIHNSNAITNKGHDILSSTNDYDALKNLANDVSSEGLVKGEGDIKNLVAKTQTGVDAYKDSNTSKRQKNKIAKQVGNLSQTVDSVRNEQNLAEIRSSLESKGLSKSQAKKAAELLNEALYADGAYSKELYKSVMNDEGVWDTLRELVSSPDSTLKSRNLKHKLGRVGLKVGEDGAITSSVNAEEAKSGYVDENLSFVEDASKREYEASVDGKSIDTTTGKAVDIVEVASIKDGKMMLKVKDADGAESVVSARDVTYASESEALIYEAVAHMGLNAVSANAIVNSYNPTQDAGAFARGIQEAYRYGRYNFSMNDVYQGGKFLYNLTDKQVQDAYKLGQMQSGADTAVAVAKLKEAIANSKGKKGEGKVHFEGDAEGISEENLKDQQKVSLKTMEMLSKALGIEFYVYASYENADGERVYKDANGEVKPAPNGIYDKATGAIHIDLNAGETGEGTMLFTIAHELTHFIKAWSPAKFKVLANFLVEQYGKKGKSVEQLVRNQMEHMKASGRKNVTYDKAFEEFVADSMETMLTSGKVVEFLADVKRKDEGLWNKIKEFFSDLVEHLKKVVSTYSEFAPDTIEGQTVAEMKDVIEQLESLFTDALVDASENFRAISFAEQQTLAEVGIGFDEDTRSVHSLRYSTGRKDALGNVIDLVKVGKKEFNTEAIAQLVAKGTGRSIEDARKWVNSEIAIANIVMNHPEFLDFEADDRYEAIKKNSDYPQGTVDLSNLCPKRTEFTAMFDMLQKKYPNKLFTASDVAAMRSILKKRGITVACGACFVEDRRQLLGEIADTYIGMWKEAVETGKPLQKTNASGNKVTLTVTAALAKQYGLKKGSDILATDKYIPTQYDLTTYEGFKLLEKNHPTIAMGFNRYNNSRGQQAGRLIEGRAEYNRQILGWSPTKVKSVNNNGGLRIFSFSDFEVVHLLDLVQVILDCSAMGVKIQGYTKIPSFARLIRETGIKINRSLIPKGQTGLKTVNGKQVLDYDTTEGIDINDENFIDERDNPNVGNILIGINPTQIGIAMLDDFVDYIIPFHTNKSKDICKALGLAEWVNYKESQHEKDVDTGKASKHNVNIYTEVIGKYHPTNKVEFVDAFLKVCKAQKKIPRYSEFLNKEYKADGAYSDEYGSYDFTYREGYHKLLVDFKMFDHNGNILPQGEITPNLDDAFMAELLKGEVDKKQNYEFPKEVYEQLDKEFGEEELHSDRMLSKTYVDNLLNGFGITMPKDSVHVQRQVLSTLEKEGFFTDAELRRRTDTNEETGMVIETNKSGIDETFDKANYERVGRWKKFAKLATIRRIPEVIRYGHMVTHNAQNMHGGPARNKSFAYIEHTIEEDGKSITLQLDIKKSPQKNKFWVHKVLRIEKVSDSPASTTSGTEAGQKITADNGGIITHPSDSVKDFDENPHSDRKKPRSAKEQRDDGYMLSESKFYQLYSAHKLDIGKRWGDIEEQIADIKTNGFKGGSGAVNVLPAGSMRISNFLGVSHYELFKRWEAEGKVEKGYAENFKKELGEEYGKPIPDDVIQKTYGPKKGDYVLLVPSHMVSDGRKVKQGFKPFDYEVVRVERDYQPYYELYEKAYKEYEKTNDGEMLYSDRNKTSVSNRALLANALESAVQNEFEKKTLAEYKEELGRADALEKELAEIRAKKRELSFAKGHKDTEALNKLRDQEIKTVNRIDIRDKKLLRLEATKPLKDIIHREREKAYKRAEKEGKEALAKYREKTAQTQRELLNRWQESRHKAVEGRNKTAMRHKIKSVVSELNQLLLRGTKDNHVMIGLQKAVASALDAVNMDTVGAEERVAKYNALIAKEKNPDVIESLTATRDRILSQGENIGEKLANLKSAYSEIKNSDDPLIANSYDEVIFSKIEAVVSSVGNTALRDMSLTQLEDVYDLYKMVLTTVRNSNKAFKAKKGEEISTISNRVMEEIEAVGGKKQYSLKVMEGLKKYGWSILKPVYAFKLIGSKTFSEVFNNVRAGEDTWARDVSEAKVFRSATSEKYQYKSWDFGKKYTFTSKSGVSFELTLEQMLSLYAYSKRKQADDHLEKGGFVFDTAIEVTEKKHGIPLKYNVTTATAHQISKETLADIISNLTTEQKGFVDEMQDYLSSVMGEKGNEVSLAMYGVKLFKEKFYFPLKSAKQFMFEQNEVAGEVKIKNAGFSKETVAHANNPIILDNFMDVWANHVNDMSMYHSFVLALEDFNRVFNYKTKTEDNLPTESVKMYLQNAYGTQATSYIKQLLTDLNGGARSDPQAGLVNKAIGKFKKASVFASMSVVVQQPSAIGRAFAYVDPKYFVGKKVDKQKQTASWNEVKKYAPIAIIKEMGYFDVGNGRSTVNYLKGDKTIMDRVDDVASWLPAKADEITWCAIWEAVKRETSDRNKALKTDSEKFLKAVGDRFTEVIVNTQVYDSVLSRSGMMRSKDTGVKMATAFMAEPTTTLNMMVDAHLQSKRGDKRTARKIRGAVVASLVINSILVSLVYAARDDDKDETYIEKYLGSLTSELTDGFNPITYLPVFKDIWSLAQGYDVERSDMALWSSLIDSVLELLDEDTSAYDKVKSFTGAVSNLFGIPVKNVWRDVEALYNVANGIVEGTPTTSAGIKYSVMDAIRSSNPLIKAFTSSPSNSQMLYDAIMSGDKAQIARVKGKFKDESAINTAIRKGLRDNDSRIEEAARARMSGDIAEYTRIVREIVGEGYFNQDLVVGAVNNAITALEKEEKEKNPTPEEEEVDEVTSIYKGDDINSALESGDIETATAIIDDLVSVKTENYLAKARKEAEKNGKTFNESTALKEAESKAKSSVKSSITSYWKPLVKEASGNTSELYRIRELLWKTGLYGKTYAEVYSVMKEWMKD